MVAVTYKTHILLGIKAGYPAVEIARWEHTPTGPQVKEKVDARVSDFNEFTLWTPVGDNYPGTYQEPTYDCCG